LQGEQGGALDGEARQQGRDQAFRVIPELQQGFQLLGRPADDAVQGKEFAQPGQAPAQFARRGQRLALAQQDRKGRVEHFAQRVVVVLGRPLAEFEQTGRQYRLCIQRFAGSAQLFLGNFGGGTEAQADADLFLAAERHAHPGPHGRRVELRGQEVVEVLAQGRGQGQLQVASGHAASLSVRAGSRPRAGGKRPGEAAAGCAVS